MKLTKIVALFDIHYPHNIDLSPVLSFIQDFKPNRIILGGDILDLAYLSHWEASNPGKWEGHQLENDINWLSTFIDNLNKDIKPERIDYILGNHEKWLVDYTDRIPYLKGEFDLAKRIHAKDKNVVITGFNRVLSIGKLNFIHGVYCNELHAKKHLQVYQKNIRTGHTHDHQVFSSASPINNHVKNAMSCGCLCNRNAEYAHGKPNKWVNGFYVAYMLETGIFYDYFVPIVNGKFVFNGKIYA